MVLNAVDKVVDDKALVKARHRRAVALQMLGRLEESLDDYRCVVQG